MVSSRLELQIGRIEIATNRVPPLALLRRNGPEAVGASPDDSQPGGHFPFVVMVGVGRADATGQQAANHRCEDDRSRGHGWGTFLGVLACGEMRLSNKRFCDATSIVKFTNIQNSLLVYWWF